MTTSRWTRTMPGWYVSRIDPRVEVKTYCDCSYSSCMGRWAVYFDGESVPSTMNPTRAEATEMAERIITDLATTGGSPWL